MDPVSLASPSQVLAHTGGGAGVLSPSAEQAGAGPQKRGDKSMSVSPSAPVTLCSSIPGLLSTSHTLFE